MTSNHRPTLESKRGKKRPISDTIVHARSIKQHSSLKYRTDVPQYDIDQDEVKTFNAMLNKGDLENAKPEEGQKPTKDKVASSSAERSPEPSGKDDSGSSSGSEDLESDSDEEDTAALLAELEKIKKEKQVEEEKKLDANPLLSTQKKSWRQSAFKKKGPATKSADQFTTNSLDTEYHKSFMKKFIR